MNVAFAESTVESAALAWLESLGYRVLFGPAIAPGLPAEAASAQAGEPAAECIAGRCA